MYYRGPSSLTAQGLQDLDLGVDASLEVDGIQAFLAGPGADAAKGALNDVGAATDSLSRAVDLAQTAVNTLSDSVAHYRSLAQQNQKSRDQTLTDAQNRVDVAQAYTDGLTSRINKIKGQLHSDCSFQKKVCVNVPFVGRVCRKVEDLSRDTQCAADNTANGLEIGRLQTEQTLANEALKRAQDALALAKDGNRAIPIDDDPVVAYWIDLQTVAQGALETARQGAAGVEAATAAANRALSLFQAGAAAVKVTQGHLRGSLKQMVEGNPLILDVDYQVSGQSLTTRIPFSLVDMAYTSRYLELVALRAAYVATQLDPDASDVVKKAFQDQYLAKQTEVDSAVDAINALNNVPPEGGTPDSGSDGAGA